MTGPLRASDVDTWLLPGDLARTLQAGNAPRLPRAPGSGRHPRTARDWAVDSLVLVACVAFWLIETLGWSSAAEIPDWLRRLDVVSGVVMIAALWWRRELPIAVGLLGGVIGAFSNSAGLAVLIAFFSLALHRGWRWGYGVAVAAQVMALPHLIAFVPDDVAGSLAWILVVTLMVLLSTTAGLMVRARRQLVWVLAERAEAARLDRERSVVAARAAERELIAREMHDVLAHRLSLLAVHAGALEYRISQAEGAPLQADELAASIAVVRASARLSLEELREVLQVMRGNAHQAGDAVAGTAPPAPTLASLPLLVAEARAAGQRIVLEGDLVDGAGAVVPAAVQRTVYRVVQEGLTNARKHAPGAAVLVVVETDDAGVGPRTLRVGVSNPVLPGVSPAEMPGAGAGHLGLAERVELHGGTLRHGVRSGRYVLEAEMPLTLPPGAGS